LTVKETETYEICSSFPKVFLKNKPPASSNFCCSDRFISINGAFIRGGGAHLFEVLVIEGDLGGPRLPHPRAVVRGFLVSWGDREESDEGFTSNGTQPQPLPLWRRTDVCSTDRQTDRPLSTTVEQTSVGLSATPNTIRALGPLTGPSLLYGGQKD
jgi:hypothetical protein